MHPSSNPRGGAPNPAPPPYPGMTVNSPPPYPGPTIGGGTQLLTSPAMSTVAVAPNQLALGPQAVFANASTAAFLTAQFASFQPPPGAAGIGGGQPIVFVLPNPPPQAPSPGPAPASRPAPAATPVVGVGRPPNTLAMNAPPPMSPSKLIVKQLPQVYAVPPGHAPKPAPSSHNVGLPVVTVSPPGPIGTISPLGPRQSTSAYHSPSQPPLSAPRIVFESSSGSYSSESPVPRTHSTGSMSGTPTATSSSSPNQASPNAGRTTSLDPLRWGYAIVDPLHPTLQRVPIPQSVVTHTKAVETYDTNVANSSLRPCSSTVCLRFTTKDAPPEESCPLGAACTNFHVEKWYLDAAREVSTPLCCTMHNDFFGREIIRSQALPAVSQGRYVLILEDRSEVELQSCQLAFTVGLEQLAARASGARIINAKRQMCRLHKEGKCKWTKDCGHVHVCRELLYHLQQFHYPSLHFALMSDQTTAITRRLTETPAMLAFVKSDCAEPLKSTLIDQRKWGAVQALRECGVTFTQQQMTRISNAGTASVPNDALLMEHSGVPTTVGSFRAQSHLSSGVMEGLTDNATSGERTCSLGEAELFHARGGGLGPSSYRSAPGPPQQPPPPQSSAFDDLDATWVQDMVNSLCSAPSGATLDKPFNQTAAPSGDWGPA